MSLPDPGQQMAADAAAAVSVATAGWTWLAHANDVLQFLATLVAIAAGIAAARFHWVKTRALRQAAAPRPDLAADD